MERLFVTTLKNFPVDSNCYVISFKGSNNCIIVDPAQGNGDAFYSFLSERNLKPDYLILTHEHFDHISSVEHLRSKFNCRVVASVVCSSNITNPKKNLSIFYDQVGFSCKPADILIDHDNQRISWLNYTLLFMLTPGHSNGGLCFSIDNNVFTGDTIMNGYKPVVKLPGGDKTKIAESMTKITDSFSPDANLYPGHGDKRTFSQIRVSTFINI